MYTSFLSCLFLWLTLMRSSALQWQIMQRELESKMIAAVAEFWKTCKETPPPTCISIAEKHGVLLSTFKAHILGQPSKINAAAAWHKGYLEEQQPYHKPEVQWQVRKNTCIGAGTSRNRDRYQLPLYYLAKPFSGLPVTSTQPHTAGRPLQSTVPPSTYLVPSVSIKTLGRNPTCWLTNLEGTSWGLRLAPEREVHSHVNAGARANQLGSLDQS